jgi:hypothetical protein
MRRPRARAAQRGHRVVQPLGAYRALVEVAHAHRVEHRGDAGASDLRIVSEQRGKRRPAHAGTRFEVLLEVVGVQLHLAGDQRVAVEVLRGGQRGHAPIQAGDRSGAHLERADEDFVGGDDACVAEELRRHAGSATVQS